MRDQVMCMKMPKFLAWAIGVWCHSNPGGKMQCVET